MSKNKIELTPNINVDDVLIRIQELYKNEKINTIDGVKIDFAEQWVHLRKSNTEPIIRIYSEASTTKQADKIAQEMIDSIKKIIEA